MKLFCEAEKLNDYLLEINEVNSSQIKRDGLFYLIILSKTQYNCI